MHLRTESPLGLFGRRIINKYAEPRWRIETPRSSSRDIAVSNVGNYKRLLVVSFSHLDQGQGCVARSSGFASIAIDIDGISRMLCVRSDFLQPCPGAVGAGEEMRDAEFSYGMLGPTPYCIRSPLAPSLSFALEPEGSFREGTLVVYIG